MDTSQSVLPKRNIKQDYLEGADALRPFYQYKLDQPDFRQIIADKAFPDANRKLLCKVLEDQYKGLTVSEKTRKNLNLLKESNTYSLTTGHQLNLFGGPLYTPYKVLTVIKLAEQLTEEIPENNFVPIFWIHTEDHDFEEINHYFSSFSSRHTYTAPFEGPTGRHILNDEIKGLIPDSFPENLKQAYQPGRSLGEASLRFHNELFGEYGVIILDADQPELKGLFAEVVREELLEQKSYHRISETSTLLEAAGYPLQIHPREVNLFYLDDHLRNRLIPDGDQFKVADSPLVFSKDDLLNLSVHQPGYFSPNVSLRPLYQEMILPNLAYCGGWGELAYWMQLKGIFDHFEVNFPLLLPRMSATLFRSDTLQKWKEMGFEASDIKKDLHVLFKEYMPNVWQSAEYEQLSSQVLNAFDDLHTYIETLSATLPRSVEGQKVKSRHFIENIRKKIHKVVRHDHPQVFDQISNVKKEVQPDRLVQERLLNLAAFPEYSPEELLKKFYQACEPLGFDHSFIEL